MTMINPAIFKAYDIRGLFPEEFNVNDLEEIVGAYLFLLSQKLNKPTNQLRLSIGKDIRPESTEIYNQLSELLVKAGVQVVSFDFISVNDLYFSVGYYNFDGGLMATASHNPAGYGGIKMVTFNGNKKDGLEFITGEEIKNHLQPVSVQVGGTVTSQNIFSDHVNWLIQQINLADIKPLKLVVDTGGGMNILLLKKLVEQLPVTVEFVNAELDSTFSKRAPNPLTAGAVDQSKKVLLTNQADLGLIYDIDGDRVFLLDEKGELVAGDMTLLVIAEYLLKLYPNAGVAYNAICSLSVPEKISSWNGVPLRSKVGYKNLSQTMKTNNGIMSGEVSSHFAFADSWYADSAFLASLYVLLALSSTNSTLSEIITNNRTWFRADEVNIKTNNTLEIIAELKVMFAQEKIDELDGLTVNFNDWWFNVRPSNTEPLLRLTVETKKAELLEEKHRLIQTIIDKIITSN